MLLKRINGAARVAGLAGVAAITALLAGPALAAEGHAPHVVKQSWTFGGVFGQYDSQQLQRGLKIYREVCANCHSMTLVPFRALTDPRGPALTEEAAKQIASEYRIPDINNETGQPFERPGALTDHFPSPYANTIIAAQANGGAIPPDFSLIAKARAVHRGFPGFVVDAIAGYAENGPDYIHALLLGYRDPPAGVETVPGRYFNTNFINGNWIAMPPPLSDGQITYTDGTPETLEQYSSDISAFLMWAAEPKLEQRKQLGFRVMIFLAVFAVMLYLVKQKLWRNIEH
jgi:cytochrome c1